MSKDRTILHPTSRAEATTAVSRGVGLLGAVLLPLACESPASAARGESAVMADVVAELVARADRTNAAFIGGRMSEWMGHLGPIPDDFTLMQPTGGPASRGFNPTPERLEQMAQYYSGGRATLEVVETYASSDLVVLAVVERQRAVIGGLPEQDWSLRVTLVYRRNGDAWEMVHRHADPLVRNVGLGWTAALAKGTLTPEGAPGPSPAGAGR